MIYIVRHTKKDRQGTIPKGQSYAEYTKGLSLMPEGILHAERIANFLAEEANIRIIITSHFRRAIQTAEIIGDKLNIDDIKIDQRLNERTLCTGDTPVEQVHRYNELSLQDWSWSAPGGESMDSTSQRFRQVVNSIDDSVAGDVLIVSHSRIIQAYAGNSDHDAMLNYRSTDPAMIIPYGTILRLQDGSVCVLTRVQ